MIRERKECDICKKSISISNYSRHYTSCSKPKPKKKIRGVDFDPNIGFKNGTRKVWNKGLTKDDPRVKKYGDSISVSTKGKSGRVWTDEQKLAKSIWRKQYHLENPEAHPNRKLAGNRTKISYPEQIAYDWMVENGIAFEHQKQIGKYFPDFVIDNLIIEIDGEYWHNDEKDKLKDEFFNRNGYTVLRIKAKEHIQSRLSEVFSV